ncbi:MAG TPA: NUDIX domain-containing protein [Candidatus Paceibacterota bacterium]
MMRMVIVNENDEVIGSKEREDRNTTDINRVTGMWLLDENKNVLIARRALDKFYDPGKWGMSVAGTVEENESYIHNILKEVQEELGIKVNESSVVVGTKRFVEAQHKYFFQSYVTYVPEGTQCVIQKSEVESVQWISFDALAEWFARAPHDFTRAFGLSFENLKSFLFQQHG